MASWKRDAASGLIIVVPILISVYVVAWLYWQLAGIPVLESLAEYEKVAVLLVMFVVVVLGVGYMMRTKMGDLVEARLDSAANRLPLIRVIYNASKMAVETALSGTEELQTPVKLEPWDGIRMTAFKTGKRTGDGREVLFLPTAPNITTGYVIEVEPHQYETSDERVEEALTRILSAGFGDTNDSAGVAFPIGDGADAGEGVEAKDGGEGVEAKDGGEAVDDTTSDGESVDVGSAAGVADDTRASGEATADGDPSDGDGAQTSAE